MQIVCKGCGETIDYRVGDLPDPEAFVAAHDHAPGRSRLRLTGGLMAVAVALVLGVCLLLLATGVITLGDGTAKVSHDLANPSPVTRTVAVPSQPAPATGKKPARLRRRSFAGRFSIGIASDWVTETGETSTRFISPKGKAELDLYFQAGEHSAHDLREAAARFLRGLHSRGKLLRTRWISLAGTNAVRIPDAYPGGTDTAVVLATHGFTYLLLLRKDDGLSQRRSQECEAELASFRPA